MIFDVYFAQPTAKGLRPGVTPEPMEWSDIRKLILENENWAKQIDDYRETGDTKHKMSLPAINFVGQSVRGRSNDAMIPTQLFMIDIDHIPADKDCRQVWDTLCMKVDWDWIVDNVILAHISPSGHGIHIIFKSQGYPTLIENMNAVNEIFNFLRSLILARRWLTMPSRKRFKMVIRQKHRRRRNRRAQSATTCPNFQTKK